MFYHYELYSPLLAIKMSQDQSYWSSAFKPFESMYGRDQWRNGPVSRKFSNCTIDPHDFVKEYSILSSRGYARLLKSPLEGIDYPRECAKHVRRYYDCRSDLGVHSLVDPSPLQCNNDKAKIFEECPHWVIENMAYKRKYYKRAEEIDRLTYQRAMEVSDYNK